MPRGLMWAAAMWLPLLGAIAWRGRRYRPDANSILGLPFRREFVGITLLLLGTLSFVNRTGAADTLANPLIFETILRGLMSSLALLVMAPVAIERIRRQRRPPGLSLLLLFAFLLVALISALYSAAPLVTIGKVYELSVAFVIVLAIAYDDEAVSALRDCVRFSILLQAALVSVAVLGFFLMPSVFSDVQGRPGFVTAATMVSPYHASNGLGSFGALVSIYSLSVILTAKRVSEVKGWALVWLVATASTVLSSARQGVILWVFAAGVLLWFRRRELLLLFVFPVFTYLIASNWQVLVRIFERGQSQGNFESLTGRTAFWQSALAVWRVHPWTGYGFGAGGRFVALYDIGADAVGNLHNGYLEALTGVGLFGFLPLLATMFLIGLWSVRSLGEGRFVAEASLVPLMMLHNVVSMDFGGWLGPFFLIYMMLVVLADLTRPIRGRSRESGHPANA